MPQNADPKHDLMARMRRTGDCSLTRASVKTINPDGIQIDVPCSNGRCANTQTYPSTFLPVGVDTVAEVQVQVLDPNGNLFATQGILLPQ